MIKKGSFFIDSVNILVERRFCQEIQYRIAHCDHFHLLKNPTVGSRNRLQMQRQASYFYFNLRETPLWNKKIRYIKYI